MKVIIPSTFCWNSIFQTEEHRINIGADRPLARLALPNLGLRRRGRALSAEGESAESTPTDGRFGNGTCMHIFKISFHPAAKLDLPRVEQKELPDMNLKQS